MRWTGRRSDDDEEQWAGTTVGDPLPSDEAGAAPAPRSAVRAFVHRFLTPRWTASETLTEKTWGDEMEDLDFGEKPRSSIDEYKGEFSWVVVDNDLRLGQVAKGGSNIESEQEISQMPRSSESRAASISVGQGAAASAFCMGQRVLTDSVWPFIKSFAYMSFPDKAQERAFQHEVSHCLSTLTTALADEQGGCVRRRLLPRPVDRALHRVYEALDHLELLRASPHGFTVLMQVLPRHRGHLQPHPARHDCVQHVRPFAVGVPGAPVVRDVVLAVYPRDRDPQLRRASSCSLSKLTESSSVLWRSAVGETFSTSSRFSQASRPLHS